MTGNRRDPEASSWADLREDLGVSETGTAELDAGAARTIAPAQAVREPPHLVATRAAYDTVAGDYADLLRSRLAELPFDRAMLGAFAELVRADGDGPVADLGCGPGRITGQLRSLGLSAFGVDLSPEMVAVARRTHPDLRFDVGSMTALDFADGTLGGVVAWYSIIHTPPERRGGATPARRAR